MKEGTGTDNSTYERNVQGQTIPQVKAMCRDRQYHRGKEYSKNSDRPLHKSGNLQGHTITQVKECTGTDNSTGDRNVQGQTIPQMIGMYRDRQFHR